MKKHVTAGELVYYALPAFPIALLGLPLYIYLPTYYAQELGLGVSAVGLILLAARLFDMVTDPAVGIVSDRLGGRKPPMLAGAVIVLGAFFALTYPDADADAYWLLGFSLLIYTGWSLLNIPYLTLNAEISPHYHDKTRLAAAREFGAIIGVVTALTLPYAFSIADDAGATLQLMWQILMLLTPPLMLLAWYGIPEPERKAQHRSPTLNALRTLWRREDGTPRLMAAYLINNLANALPATLFLFFVELVLRTPYDTGVLLLVYFVSGLTALPLWTRLSKRIGKRRSWMLSMLLASAAFAFVPLLGEGDTTWFFLICLVSGFSLGADMALPAAIQSDAAHAAETGGERVAGIFFGLWSMLTKLALALAVGLAFGLLGLAGFDPEAPSAASLTLLSLLYGGLPVLLKVAALLLLGRYREVSPGAH
jgi:Na+/melibiose symporter-like transporter